MIVVFFCIKVIYCDISPYGIRYIKQENLRHQQSDESIQEIDQCVLSLVVKMKYIYKYGGLI